MATGHTLLLIKWRLENEVVDAVPLLRHGISYDFQLSNLGLELFSERNLLILDSRLQFRRFAQDLQVLRCEGEAHHAEKPCTGDHQRLLQPLLNELHCFIKQKGLKGLFIPCSFSPKRLQTQIP